MQPITTVLLTISFGLISMQTVQTAPVSTQPQAVSSRSISAEGMQLQYDHNSVLKMMKRQACICCKAKDNGGQAGQRGGHQAIGGSPGPTQPPHNGGGGGKGGGPGEGSGNCCPSC